jgi:DivIVA domain-containing protein
MSREEAVVQEPNREFLLYEAPDLIRSQSFPQARRGFDPKEVEGFLRSVAEWFDALRHDVERLEAERATLQESAPERDVPPPTVGAAIETESSEEVVPRIITMLRHLDGEFEQLQQDAREETNRRLEEARATADQIRKEAAEEAEQVRAEARGVLEEAQDEARRALEELVAERSELGGELHGLRDYVVGLIQYLDGHLTSLEPAAAASDEPSREDSQNDSDDVKRLSPETPEDVELTLRLNGLLGDDDEPDSASHPIDPSSVSPLLEIWDPLRRTPTE